MRRGGSCRLPAYCTASRSVGGFTFSGAIVFPQIRPKLAIMIPTLVAKSIFSCAFMNFHALPVVADVVSGLMRVPMMNFLSIGVAATHCADPVRIRTTTGSPETTAVSVRKHTQERRNTSSVRANGRPSPLRSALQASSFAACRLHPMSLSSSERGKE